MRFIGTNISGYSEALAAHSPSPSDTQLQSLVLIMICLAVLVVMAAVEPFIVYT